MTDPPREQPARSIDAIVFDLILIGLSALLVVTSLGLRSGVGTVPLLVGIPTLLGAIVILIVDLFPRLRLPEPEPAEKEARDKTGLRSLIATPGEANEENVEIAETPEPRRRQIAFAAWMAGFVVLAALTSFYIAMPVALVVILAAIRLSWKAIVPIVGGTLLAFYGLFDLFLRVRL